MRYSGMETNKMSAEKTPNDLTLDEINQRFSTDSAAREYIESVWWPNGPVCPHCKNHDQKKIWKATPNPAKKIREGLYVCAECKKSFTCTIGTVFEDSHIPLRKWLIAWYLNCSSKKGVSSLQLQRILDLGSYRTPLFMQHRIRHALRDTSHAEQLNGIIEMDETYVGGKLPPRGTPKKLGRPGPDSHKVPVV